MKENKYFFILASIALTLCILILIKSLVLPLFGAFILALLLKPLCDYMEKIKIPRFMSSFLTVIIMNILISILFFLVFSQIKNMILDRYILINSIYGTINKVQHWASGHFDVGRTEQINYLKKYSATILNGGVDFVENTFSSTAVIFTESIFFFISLFFFLYYRAFLVSFLFKNFAPTYHPKIKNIIFLVQKMVAKYILGIFFVMLITGGLNTIGLVILGIDHAIFFGFLAGALTIIPYIGITIGAALPFLFALATTDSIWYPIGVMLIFWFVQFLEGNFITPKIVGSHVKINSFAALIALFSSGIFFGLFGIILSLPLLAIIKIISDNMTCLKPLGFLLGNPPSVTQIDKATFPHTIEIRP